MNARTRILFATDIHGSERCFRKFLSAALSAGAPDVLIIGGDITGKYIVPIIESRPSVARARFEGRDIDLESEEQILHFEQALREKGAYTWRCTPDSAESFRVDADFRGKVDAEVRSSRLRDWMELADRYLQNSGRKVFISGGNDDPWYIDSILRESKAVVCPEGQVIQISECLTMLSTGVANLTPWKCPRDVPEEEITTRISEMAAKVEDFDTCIFNLHCPPFATLLDRAPKLDKDLRIIASAFGVEEESVGSRAVRQAIEQYQPVASLHGHIHESRAFQRIGKTVSFNPGSEYTIGRLNVAQLDFSRSQLVHFDLITDLT